MHSSYHRAATNSLCFCWSSSIHPSIHLSTLVLRWWWTDEISNCFTALTAGKNRFPQLLLVFRHFMLYCHHIQALIFCGKLSRPGSVLADKNQLYMYINETTPVPFFLHIFLDVSFCWVRHALWNLIRAGFYFT